MRISWYIIVLERLNVVDFALLEILRWPIKVKVNSSKFTNFERKSMYMYLQTYGKYANLSAVFIDINS